MSSLLVFLVAYAGIGGKDASGIDRQVAAILDETAEVTKVRLTAAKRDALVGRTAKAAAILRDLDADVVIAGKVERTKQGGKVRIVVYGADGALVELVEVPLAKRSSKQLGPRGLALVRDNVGATVARLTAPPPEPEPVPEPPRVAATDDDDDAPLRVAAAAPARGGARAPWLRVAAGVGPRSRTFDPGPSMVSPYEATPVPAARVAVEARAGRHVAIGGAVERTLVMHSRFDDQELPSSILGWHATVALRLPLGALEVAALGGVGARAFEIAGAAPTPDGRYVHAIAGARLALRLGRAELRAHAAYQPVIGGDVEMVAAPSRRTGVEIGGALEVAATGRLFVLGEASYQRFTWTWDAGDGIDEYPGATLSVGARY